MNVPSRSLDPTEIPIVDTIDMTGKVPSQLMSKITVMGITEPSSDTPSIMPTN